MRKILRNLLVLLLLAPCCGASAQFMLLIEPNYVLPGIAQTLNMLTNATGNFQNTASWTYSNIADTTFATTTTAPDGVSLAQKVIANTTNGFHLLNSASITRGSVISQSFRCAAIVKAAGYTRFVLEIASGNGSSGVFAIFDIAGQQVGVGQAPFGSGFAFAGNYIIKPMPNGFVMFAMDVSTTSNGVTCDVQMDNGSGTGSGSRSFAGDGTSGFYLWKMSFLPTAAWQITSQVFSDSMTNCATVDLANTTNSGYHFYRNNVWPNAAEPGSAGFPNSFWKTTTPTPASSISCGPSGLTISQDVHPGAGANLSTAVTDAIVVSTTSGTVAGTTPGTNDTLHFGANNVPAGVAVGNKVYDDTVAMPYGAIPQGTTVSSINAGTGNVVLSNFVTTGNVGSGDSIGFSAGGFRGRVFSGSMYIQDSMLFSPSFAANGYNSWPTWFAIQMEFLRGDACNAWLEIDGIEAQPSGTGTIAPTAKAIQWVSCTSGALVPTVNAVNVTIANTGVANAFGRLWLQSSINGTTGIQQRYLNGVFVPSSEYVYNSGSSPNLLGNETGHWPIIFGTGDGKGGAWPVTHSNVSVSCANPTCMTVQ